AAVRHPELITEVARKFGRCATVVNIDPRRVRRALLASAGSAVRGSPDPAVSLDRRSQAPQGRPAVVPCAGSGDPRTAEAGEFWEVHINGGRVPTGLEAVAWARRVEELGAGEIVLTS